MAFMVPVVTQENFLRVETSHGTELIPADLVNLCFRNPDNSRIEEPLTDDASLSEIKEYCGSGEPLSVEIIRGKFFARLSAPGYLDATEWVGPFDTEAEARDDIATTHDVCGMCGEDLGDKDGTFCGSCEPEEEES